MRKGMKHDIRLTLAALLILPMHLAAQRRGIVDLCRLAGLYPAGALMEIMNEDGTMARMPELQKMAAEWGLRIITIKDLIA